MEQERLDRFPTHLKLLKMDSDFDVDKERECSFCFYDLHLSAAGCKCSPDKYSCLRHSSSFCSCEMDKKIILVRYTMDELNKLVEALEGEADAIKIRANKTAGINSADDGEVCTDKLDLEKDMCTTTKGHEERESSSCCEGTKEKPNLNAPCSHSSSKLVQSEFHRGTFSSSSGSTLDGRIGNENEKKSVHGNEIKVELAGSMDLNCDVMSGENESCLLPADDHQNKGFAIDNVCYLDGAKEQDKMEIDYHKDLSDSFALLKKDYPSCSRDARNSSSPSSGKLFGVDLQMHPDVEVSPNNVVKIEVKEPSNINLHLTDQSYLMQSLYNSVEPITLGSVMYRKLWCTKHAIFPKGMQIFNSMTFSGLRLCLHFLVLNKYGSLIFYSLLVNF